MSDEKLRFLERRWKESSTVEDEANFYFARLRLGEISLEGLILISVRGNEAAWAILHTAQYIDYYERCVKCFGDEIHRGKRICALEVSTLFEFQLHLWERDFDNTEFQPTCKDVAECIDEWSKTNSEADRIIAGRLMRRLQALRKKYRQLRKAYPHPNRRTQMQDYLDINLSTALRWITTSNWSPKLTYRQKRIFDRMFSTGMIRLSCSEFDINPELVHNEWIMSILEVRCKQYSAMIKRIIVERLLSWATPEKISFAKLR